MTFQDIFKKTFLEGYTSTDITLRTVGITLGITCLFAIYIFLVYRIRTRKTFYSKSFNISIALISIITAAIIMTIQSSIVVSLGMVGALSIVRFRTAIKDPMDLIFLFWSISIGIICGAGLAGIALIASVVITIGMCVLELIPVAKAPMLLVVNANEPGAEQAIMEIVKKYSRFHQVKSRSLGSKKLDMIVEVRVKEEAEFVRSMAEVPAVVRCSLVSHDGEVTF